MVAPFRQVCETLLKKAKNRQKTCQVKQLMIVTMDRQLTQQFIRKYNMVPMPTLGMHVGYCNDTKLFVCNPIKLASLDPVIVQRPLLYLMSSINMIIYVTNRNQRLPTVGFKVYITEAIERHSILYSFYDHDGLTSVKSANAMVHIKHLLNASHHHLPAQTCLPNMEHHILSKVLSLSLDHNKKWRSVYAS